MQLENVTASYIESIEDLERCTETLCDERRAYIRKIFNGLPKQSLLQLKCGYGAKLWSNRVFTGLDGVSINPRPRLTKPIGIVTKGVFEVYQEFNVHGNDKKRRRSTKLLEAGEPFGLFEALAGIYGDWNIASGIQTFYISNRLGTTKVLNQNRCSFSGNLIQSLQHRREATYDFTELMDVRINQWNATCLVFDFATITDTNSALIIPLQTLAISQLASVIDQNPSIDFLGEHIEPSDPDAATETAGRAIESILDGHLPIYRLATSDDEPYLPFSSLEQSLLPLLNYYSVKLNAWIPCLLRDSCEAGAYFDALSFKLPSKGLASLIRQARNASGYNTKKGSKSMVKDRTIEWINYNGKSARIRPLSLKALPSQNRPAEVRELFNWVLGQQDYQVGYTWPDHNNSSVVFKLRS